MEINFSSVVRLWSNGKSPASRHFITVEKTVSEQIKQGTILQPKRGRGSVKVEARIGF